MIGLICVAEVGEDILEGFSEGAVFGGEDLGVGGEEAVGDDGVLVQG